ncbi:MAG: S24 family peptidase [Pseudomonadota bacterium]
MIEFQGTRLKEIRSFVKKTQQELADSLDITRSKVSDIEAGNQKITTELAEKISKVFNISFEWLLTGEGHMFSSLASDNFFNIKYFPHVKSAAGSGCINHDETIEYIPFPKIYINNIIKVSPQNLNVICVSGDSMYPTIQDQDLILIDRSIDNLSKEGIYTFRQAENLQIKRLQIIENNNIKVNSDNKFYDSYITTLKDIEIIGIVVWYGRKI